MSKESIWSVGICKHRSTTIYRSYSTLSSGNHKRQTRQEHEPTIIDIKPRVLPSPLYWNCVDKPADGIWIIDVNAQTVYANQRMAEILGTTPAEMVGHPSFDYVFPEDVPAASTFV